MQPCRITVHCCISKLQKRVKANIDSLTRMRDAYQGAKRAVINLTFILGREILVFWDYLNLWKGWVT